MNDALHREPCDDERFTRDANGVLYILGYVLASVQIATDPLPERPYEEGNE